VATRLKTAVPYSEHSYLEANAEARPRSPAAWTPAGEVTFAELWERVLAAAATLHRRGAGPGSVVGLRLPNRWEYVAAEIAIAYLGAVVVPLPLALGEHELRFVLQRSGADPALGEADVPELFERGGAPPAPAPPDPARVVEIALTSGSTGLPKLAGLTAEVKQVTFEGFTTRIGIAPEDRVLPMSPLTQGIGGMTLYCLRRGAALVLPGDPRWTAERTLEVIGRARPTVIVGVPTNVIRMLSSPAFDPELLRGVRVTAVAGAPMPPEVAERWETLTGSRVCVFYGSMDAGQLAVASPDDPQAKRWTTVGRPHERARLAILDPAGRPVPAGGSGEICMAGPLVQPRYWGEEKGPYAEDGWAHLGDLGVLDPDGFLRVVGRVKDIVIRGGANINPYEVESMLRGHPRIVDACVVGRPHPELGEVALAFVVTRPGEDDLLASVQEHLRRQGLARYKWPEEVREVPELPLSGPGKVDRRRLREAART
jgi:long-chain acyl-CoA synthetase